jgi:hypothetical protein
MKQDARRRGRSRIIVRALAFGATAGVFGAGCGSDDRPHAWGYISPAILQPTCATPSCHSRAVAVAGLDFSDPDRGYHSLTGVSVYVAVSPDAADGGACESSAGRTLCLRPRPLVIPYDPTQSRLVNMLRARGAPRMPPDRPLSEPDIALIERWILDGARKLSDDETDGGGNGGENGDAGGTDDGGGGE